MDVSTTFSLVTRVDTGTINSSPRISSSLPLRLQQGCSYTIPLPVSDPDDDTIRCRWASGTECGSVCSRFTGAMLDGDSCTITYSANNGTGHKVAAIMIEDFAPGSSTHPLSSVALQFLVLVVSASQPCSAKTQYYRFPVITLHPSDVTMFLNETINTGITLSCMADEAVYYYWERQNSNISSSAVGVYSNTLTLTNVQPEDTGNYRCVVLIVVLSVVDIQIMLQLLFMVSS